MVRSSGASLAPVARSGVIDMPDPSWRFLMQRGVPTFAVEGFAPVLLFYAVWKVTALAPAIRRRDRALRGHRLVAGTSGSRRWPLVWGVYCLARAGLRLVALLGARVGGFVQIGRASCRERVSYSV